MERREPGRRSRLVTRAGGDDGRASSRGLQVFRILVLVVLVGVTLYGMLNRGLFGLERWLPVAVGILAVLFITLFVRGFFRDVPRVGWMLVGLLGALVAVKGLSYTWSISHVETVREVLRSSMYLAVFTLAVASFSARRLVGPFVDGTVLIAGAITGYGVLQKTRPTAYPSNTPDGVRVGSTLEYANTVAVVVGIGIVLSLARMTQLRSPFARGFYAALLVVFGAILYLTFSRGGMLSLAVGLVALFVVGRHRLQTFVNLLLVALPLGWLLWRVQGLETFFRFDPLGPERAADGAAFGAYLAISIVSAFVLQAVYALLVERYELAPGLRRVLGAAAVLLVLVGAGSVTYIIVGNQAGADSIAEAFTRKVEETGDISDRLTSVSANSRSRYWNVAWNEWKERPLTGTGAGTFLYTWQQDRPGFGGVKQVHNVYLEQGTETGIVAFVALVGFAVLLAGYVALAAWLATGGRRTLLAGMTAAIVVYLFSSALEWHWYIPPSTTYFFILAGVAVRLASQTDWAVDEPTPSSSNPTERNKS